MKKRYTIGIDLGGTNTKLALVNDEGRIVARRLISTGEYPAKKAFIEAISDCVKEILRSKRLAPKAVRGIGIGTPGLVDSRKGIVYSLTNIPGWHRVSLKKLLERSTRLPVFVDNDVNLMALGELKFGAGRRAKNIVCLTLGTGVGGGIIIGGRLYRGATLSAGEIGHIPINENGPCCNCGGRGCLERYVGNKYIVALAARKIRQGKKTIVTKLVNNDLSKVTPFILSKAAGRGDELAISIWQETGKHLGVALAGVVNLLNPEVIVIGGGVANAGKVLFDALRKTVRERAMEIPAKAVKIVRAKLGQDAGIMGAVVLVKLKT